MKVTTKGDFSWFLKKRGGGGGESSEKWGFLILLNVFSTADKVRSSGQTGFIPPFCM